MRGLIDRLWGKLVVRTEEPRREPTLLPLPQPTPRPLPVIDPPTGTVREHAEALRDWLTAPDGRPGEEITSRELREIYVQVAAFDLESEPHEWHQVAREFGRLLKRSPWQRELGIYAIPDPRRQGILPFGKAAE